MEMAEFVKALAVALGLSEDATAEQVIEKCKALASPPLPASTEDEDEDKPSEAMTALSRKLIELSAQVAALTVDRNRNRTAEIVRANAKKIPPALEAWALSQTPETIEAFVKTAPDYSPAVVNQPKVEPVIALTAEERHYAEKFKIDPALFLKHKTERLARENSMKEMPQ